MSRLLISNHASVIHGFGKRMQTQTEGANLFINQSTIVLIKQIIRGTNRAR